MAPVQALGYGYSLGAEAKERENEAPQTTGPSAPASGHLGCQFRMYGNQIPACSITAFCAEMPFLRFGNCLSAGL